jgi:hypothetical protein
VNQGPRAQVGVKASNRFRLLGEFIIAQKSPLISQRNPKLPDVGQLFTMHWINDQPQCPFTVRRLLPWVHLKHWLPPRPAPVSSLYQRHAVNVAEKAQSNRSCKSRIQRLVSIPHHPQLSRGSLRRYPHAAIRRKLDRRRTFNDSGYYCSVLVLALDSHRRHCGRGACHRAGRRPDPLARSPE